MARYLYEVTLSGGKNNENFSTFLTNVQNLGAKPPDFSGIGNLCIISHHVDLETLHLLCTDGFKGKADGVTVTEITTATLASSDLLHRRYTDLIRNYFLPHNNYPKIRI